LYIYIKYLLKACILTVIKTVLGKLGLLYCVLLLKVRTLKCLFKLLDIMKRCCNKYIWLYN